MEEEKAKLRKKLGKKSQSLNSAERHSRSEKVLNQLLRHPQFLKARTVLIYVALESEVETRPFLEEALKQGKQVLVPRLDTEENRLQMIKITRFEELRPGGYGVLEPVYDAKRLGNPADLELAVVPGTAFDPQGVRLGRGKGYFDRFLAETPRAYKIGLAFEYQIVKKLPRAAHDILMDEVLIG